MALSQRGLALLSPLPLSLATAYEARRNRYSAENEDGFIDLSIAENVLSLEDIGKYLSNQSAAPDSWRLYDASHGSEAFLDALAGFITEHLFKGWRCDKEMLLATAGAGVALDIIMNVLTDVGDKILICGPAYSGFRRDLCMRNATKIVVGYGNDDKVTVEGLEEGWEEGVKVALITSPNNPTGEVLTKNTVEDIVKWGREKGLHLVWDEVYGTSVFGEGERFWSVGEVLQGDLGNDVHIVWTVSKDFCWSGGKIGMIYTGNKQVVRAIRGGLAYLGGASREAQWKLMGLVRDEKYLKRFVERNKQRLRTMRDWVTKKMESVGVEIFEGGGGLFLWMNLTKWLRGQSWDEEEEVWRRMMERRVLVTMGKECFSRQPGWFRLCFAASQPQFVRIGVNRLVELLRTELSPHG